jgi:hypothetical protein
MPVTPKQTRVLRDRFGDSAANEIVDVLNNVEASSVNELRTLNELNFARFEANMDRRFESLETKMDLRFTASDAKMDRRLAEVDAKISERFLTHTRWMLGAWTTMFLALLGLWLRK